jgi:hypothetical protein
VTAVVAVDAKESIGEDAALEIAAHLALDEAGDGRPHRSCVGEEWLEFVADDGVEEGLLGLLAFVPVDGWGPIRTGLGTRKCAWSGRCLVVPAAENCESRFTRMPDEGARRSPVLCARELSGIDERAACLRRVLIVGTARSNRFAQMVAHLYLFTLHQTL